MRSGRIQQQREDFEARRQGLAALDLVFVDETWVGLAMSRMYGYSPAGQEAVIHREVRGPKVSAIGAMSCRGPEALAFIKGGMKGVDFVHWVKTKLVRRLRAGSIVVMDQLQIHKNAEARRAIEAVGASIAFLPAYSPELNPIEHIWSIVKSAVKTVQPETIAEMKAVFGQAWGVVAPDVCSRTVRHCGYVQSC